MRSLPLVLATVLAGLAGAVLPTPALAADPPLPPTLPASRGPALHVAPTGHDRRGAGRLHDPLRTIEAALKRVRPGWRIVLHGGRYLERMNVRVRGTRTRPITIEGARGDTATIARGTRFEGASDVRIRNLTFDGSTSSDWGVFVFSSRRLEFAGNTMRNWRDGQGLLVAGGTDIRVIGNRMTNIDMPNFGHAHGIYCKQSRRLLIAGNLIWNNPDGFGVQLFGDCDDTTIVHNTLHGNATSGVTVGGNAERGTSDNTLIAENVITGHTGSTPNSQSGFGVAAYLNGANTVIRNNLFWDNARGAVEPTCRDCLVENNIDADPRYLDAAKGNFALGPDSAALSRGAGGGLKVDAAGLPRVQGPAADLGALEAPDPAEAAARMVGRLAAALLAVPHS